MQHPFVSKRIAPASAEPLLMLRRFHRTNVGDQQMSFLLYLALFIAACGFGWWAKNADRQP